MCQVKLTLCSSGYLKRDMIPIGTYSNKLSVLHYQTLCLQVYSCTNETLTNPVIYFYHIFLHFIAKRLPGNSISIVYNNHHVIQLEVSTVLCTNSSGAFAFFRQKQAPEHFCNSHLYKSF